MSIPFTQYIRPDGEPRPVTIERPLEIERLAMKFMEAAGRFESEVLVTKEVSLTAMMGIEGEDKTVAIELCENGPNVPAAVDRLVTKAAKFIEPSPSSQTASA